MRFPSHPNRFPRRAALALSAVLLCLLLPGCAKERSPYGGTVVLSTLDEPQGLNPLFYLDTFSPNVGSLIFNSLVALNERLEFVPELASSWQVSADGLTWDFNLRQGVRFHDGRELQAEDVVFTFRSVLDPASESPLAPQYTILEGVEALERFRVRFRLKEPYSAFPYLLLLEIIPAHLFAGGELSFGEFGRNPVGTGPFRFESWNQGQITLAAWDKHFRGRPYLERVQINCYPDRSRAWAALMRGEADVVMDLDLEDYRILEQDPRFRTYGYLGVFYYTLLFNLRDPLLSDPELRRALDLAMDRRDLIAGTLSGWAVETSGPFRPGTWPYNPEVPMPAHDPEQAARILAGLGWRDSDGDRVLEKEGQELALTILANRGDLLKEAAAQRIKWQLLRLGIRAEVELMETGALFEERLFPGRFQAVILQFNAGVDPDKYTSFFWHSGRIGSSNLAGYASPEVDRLIERGRVSPDFEERRQAYRRIHALIAADRPAAFLYVRKIFFATSARIEGVNPAPELFYQSVRDWYVRNPKNERR